MVTNEHTSCSRPFFNALYVIYFLLQLSVSSVFDILESLKDIIRFLRHDDLQTCDVRRQLGYSKVLQNVSFMILLIIEIFEILLESRSMIWSFFLNCLVFCFVIDISFVTLINLCITQHLNFRIWSPYLHQTLMINGSVIFFSGIHFFLILETIAEQWTLVWELWQEEAYYTSFFYLDLYTTFYIQ